jgi:hypothetical protein
VPQNPVLAGVYCANAAGPPAAAVAAATVASRIILVAAFKTFSSGKMTHRLLGFDHLKAFKVRSVNTAGNFAAATLQA